MAPSPRILCIDAMGTTPDWIVAVCTLLTTVVVVCSELRQLSQKKLPKVSVFKLP
jgi:hypothetical protein